MFSTMILAKHSPSEGHGQRGKARCSAFRVASWPRSNVPLPHNAGARACEAQGEHADAPICGFECHVAFEVSGRVTKNYCPDSAEYRAEMAGSRAETPDLRRQKPDQSDRSTGPFSGRRCNTRGPRE